LLVFQGELVDDAHEGGDVGTELLEFSVLVVNGDSQLRDGCGEPCFVFGRAAAIFTVWEGLPLRGITTFFTPRSVSSRSTLASP
jgi:hypothetical protein